MGALPAALLSRPPCPPVQEAPPRNPRGKTFIRGLSKRQGWRIQGQGSAHVPLGRWSGQQGPPPHADPRQGDLSSRDTWFTSPGRHHPGVQPDAITRSGGSLGSEGWGQGQAQHSLQPEGLACRRVCVGAEGHPVHAAPASRLGSCLPHVHSPPARQSTPQSTPTHPHTPTALPASFPSLPHPIHPVHVLHTQPVPRCTS